MDIFSNRTFLEAEQYSKFILSNLEDGLLPGMFYRNVSDFGKGETLHIKTIGEVSIQEIAEGQPINYSPIETGEVSLQITDYTGSAWYITDQVREDQDQMDHLHAEFGRKAVRALQEDWETKALAVLNNAQDQATTNPVNGHAHRIVGSGTNNTLSMKDVIRAKLALDKAEAPYGGRIAIVDPIVEATLNVGFNGTYAVNQNPTLLGALEGGFARDHTFVMNFMGFDFITSNRLHKGSLQDGTTTVTDGVANLFMCVADDNCKPLMAAWRRMPKTEGGRNKDLFRDEYTVSCRYGLGPQRTDTLVVAITSATDFE